MLRIMKQHDGFVTRTLDVLCHLSCNITDGFFVKGQRYFMLGKRVNLIQLQRNHAEWRSVKANMHVSGDSFADFLEFPCLVKRFNASLRHKQKDFGVFRWAISFQQLIPVMGDFGSCKPNSAEKEESTSFGCWAMFFDEITVGA